MATYMVTVEFNDDGTVTIRGADGVRKMEVAEFTKKLSEQSGTIVEKHAAHTHVHLNADGKIVADEHVHE